MKLNKSTLTTMTMVALSCGLTLGIVAMVSNGEKRVGGLGLADPEPSGAEVNRVLEVTDFVQQRLWRKYDGGSPERYNYMCAFELQNKGGYGILEMNELVSNIADGLFEYTGDASSNFCLKYRDTYFDKTEWFFDSACTRKVNVFPFKVSPSKVEIVMGSRNEGEYELDGDLSHEGNVYTLSNLSSNVGSTLRTTESSRGKHFHVESIKYYYNC